MKKIVLFIVFPFFVFSQKNEKACATLNKINQYIQEIHYKPKPVNDSLSAYVYTTLLNKLDPENRLFTTVEIDELNQYKFKIDDAIIANDCSFLDQFYAIYTKCVNRYKENIEFIKNGKFENCSDETILFSKKAFPNVANDFELKKLYKKRLLFYTLQDIAEISQNKDSLETHFDELFETSKNKIFDIYTCKSNELQLSNQEFNGYLFNAFCNYFDPHTEYFSAEEKQSFLSAVSADNLSFGLIVSVDEKNKIIVDEILPDSAAFFSKKIEKNDEIIKLKYKNDEYPIMCSSMKKIEDIFSSNNYKNVDFTFRKKSGAIYTESLSKKILKDYENSVYSYVLEKDSARVGYLKIPSFYAIFENGKTNVSDDVDKELEKFNDENIDGLIVDLQNNGGGSMEEAIKLTTMFVGNNPVALLKNKYNDITVLKNNFVKKTYTKPVVVLINGLSASASEFFCNALKEYNRAIIVGDTSFGKASMQRIFPLSEAKNPDEFVKITLDEFYTISGKTNQTVGVVPDIEIPSLFNKMYPRENDNSTALKNDTVVSDFKLKTFSFPHKKEIIENSKKRIENNQSIKLISETENKINALYNAALAPIPLDFNDVFLEVNKINLLWKNIEEINQKQYALDVKNLVKDEKKLTDDFSIKYNQEKIKTIKSNLHIIEAVTIIADCTKN